MDNTVGRLQSYFPQKELEVIVGTLLGDGRLEERSKGIKSYTARLRVHHNEKQKEYVWWKYRMLKNYVLQRPREIIWVNSKRNLREVSWYFHTRSLSEFRLLHECFYGNGSKIVPEKINQLLTPRSMAVWAMDDGTFTGFGFNFNTHSFSIENQNRLRGVIRQKFEIETKLHKDRSQWKIAVNAENFPKLRNLIKPFLIPTMLYKIGVPVSTHPPIVDGVAKNVLAANTSGLNLRS